MKCTPLGLLALSAALLVPQLHADDKKPSALISKQPITIDTRLTLVRTLNAEYVRVKKPFPMGEKGITIKDGAVTPDDRTLVAMVANNGPAARPGERAQITDIEFKDNKIFFEINGGPKKKAKWYQRISVASTGGERPIAPQANADAKGSVVVLAFDKYIPNLTADQVKQLLAPVFEFGAGKSATGQDVEAMPPVLRAALKDHRALVGMNRDLVVDALGRPSQKIREKAGDVEYEEWVYGTPPADMQFIRFVGEEVTRVEVMKQDGTKEVRTAREIDLNAGKDAAVAQAASQGNTSTSADQRPSLRRPGEAPLDRNTKVAPENAPVVMVPDGGNNNGRPGQNAPNGSPGADPPVPGGPH
jgi:hypothetical protein